MIKLKPCPFCGSTSVEYFEERIFIMNNASLASTAKRIIEILDGKY